MNLNLTGRKPQNIKQSAFLDYLKSFSLNTMDSLKKLEREFKQDISESLYFQPSGMFKRIRTLLNSYEVLILQINDSFDFVEIPEFGCCVLKMFLQMMSIIKWSLKCIVARPIDSTEIKDNSSALKRSSVQQPETKQLSDKQKYKLKEQSRFIMKGLDYDMKGYQENKKQDINSQAFINTLLSAKDKVLKLQVSQSENILQEAIKNLSKKGENMNEFIEIRQNYMNNSKVNNFSLQGYSRMKDIVEAETIEKVKKMKHKLQAMFFHHIKMNDSKRKLAMADYSVQANLENPMKPKEEMRYINRLKDQVLKLEDQLFFEKDRNDNLAKLIAQKNSEHESQLLKYRTDNLLNRKPTLIKGKGQNRRTQKMTTILVQDEENEDKEFQRPERTWTINKNRKFISKSRKKIQNQGFLDNDEETRKDLSVLMSQSCLSIRENRTKSLKCIRKVYLGFDSGNLKFDYYPIPDQFKPTKPTEMLTTVHFDFSQQKSTQTILKALNLDSTIAVSSSVVSLLLFKQLSKTSGINSVQGRDSFDTQTLLKFSKPPTSRRETAIKQIALNLTSKSSRMQELWKTCNQTEIKQFAPKRRGNNSARPKSSINNPKLKQISQTYQDSQNQAPWISVKKIRASCQLLEEIRFTASDLANLFLTEENARNYEYLNLNCHPSKSKLSSRRSQCPSARMAPFSPEHKQLELVTLRNKSNKFHEHVNNLGSYIIKQMKSYKKTDVSLNHSIRSFLRYPYTFLKKSQEGDWVRFQKEEDQMELWEIKKYLYRIFNIHTKCGADMQPTICHHVIDFYQKIGIKLH